MFSADSIKHMFRMNFSFIIYFLGITIIHLALAAPDPKPDSHLLK